MNSDDMLKVVKEIGTDSEQLGHFLEMLSKYIYLDNQAEKFSLNFETTLPLKTEGINFIEVPIKVRYSYRAKPLSDLKALKNCKEVGKR
jgi:hypothetical protein